MLTELMIKGLENMLIVILVDQEKIKVVTDGFQ